MTDAWQSSWQGPKQDVARLAEDIEAHHDPEDVIVTQYEIDDHQWGLDLFAATEDELKKHLTLIIARSALRQKPEFSAPSPTGSGWIEESLRGLPPVRVANLVVHGSHDRQELKAHEKGLEIEAALAFGTGHHGTTRGCLKAYWDLTRREKFSSLLDVGTGTGVLAMAAAKWHKVRVLATDIDPEAIRTARANAKANGCPQVRFRVCPGLCHPDVNQTTYDLIFANILKRPLMLLANDMTKALKPGGVLILSGLLERDAPWVMSIYRGMGFRLEKRSVDEGWVTLVMRGTHKMSS